MLHENQIIDNTYQVIREIGSGGMGVVYLVYHIRLQKYVVLKKIKGAYSDINFIRNEVDILKELHHPYLPQVYDFFEFESELYTVIDYIDGNDFDYYIKNDYVFSEGQLIKWLNQLCDVLSYLHSQGVLHTDIKPGNIIVTQRGDICLIDFGISLNKTSDIKGLSKSYSSPEQLYNAECINNGQKEYCVDIDARTDVFSLGATYSHVMTGILPDYQAGYQTPLSQYNTTYSESLVAIIDKATAYDPSERFQSAEQMKKAIDNIKKYDSRYKKYILTQIASSVICCFLIVLGSVILYIGSVNKVSGDYLVDYTQFVDCINKGDYDTAFTLGFEMVNDPFYNSYIEGSHRAEVLCGIAECYYENGDYTQAADYYYRAINSCDDSEKKEQYYVDYAIALINNGELEKVTEILAQLEAIDAHSDNYVVITSWQKYMQGDYYGVISFIEQNIDKVNVLSTKSELLMLTGDSHQKIKNYSSAIMCYEQSISIEETIEGLRKAGNTYLVVAQKSNFENLSLINSAKSHFENIYNNYYASLDDILNLAQAYRLTGDYNRCLQVLENYVSNNNVEDFRVYMHMALACSETGGENTAVYCEKARRLYNGMSDKQKSLTDSRDLELMKSLYQVYCDASW